MLARTRSGIDRRSGADRRLAVSIAYCLDGGMERRGWKERRTAFERRVKDAGLRTEQWGLREGRRTEGRPIVLLV